MRLIITADLHYNHARSRPLAEDVIAQINRAGGDVLLVIGDTAVADGDTLEQCLRLFDFPGKKLLLAGNHELWTHRADSYNIFSAELPGRVRDLGWQWLETDPWYTDALAIVGTVGWYDYSFAQENLGIPRRFYQHKVSPGAAEHFEEFAPLLADRSDLSPETMSIVARWNDGRHVKLHRSDEAFLEEILGRLREQLTTASQRSKQIIAATHHLPFHDLLPPPHSAQWDFAKAYLGSERIGQLLLEFPKITHAYCGHSHFPARARVGHIEAINIGSGYRWKTFEVLET
jgi:predicted phosphohydrolase